jgi:hypothetical protein
MKSESNSGPTPLGILAIGQSKSPLNRLVPLSSA